MENIYNEDYISEDSENVAEGTVQPYDYKYIAGGIATVEIDSKWVNELNLLDHEEASNEERHTRKRYRVYLTDLPQGVDQISSHEPTPEQIIQRQPDHPEVGYENHRRNQQGYRRGYCGRQGQIRWEVAPAHRTEAAAPRR